jgi:hypothetical protein
VLNQSELYSHIGCFSFTSGALILIALVSFSLSIIAGHEVFAANPIKDPNVPLANLVYANRSYEMLPFVVLEEDNLEKLNFPRLPDDYKPEVNITSGSTFTVEFSKKPREVNAFVIDYDADTTEVNPLTKIGKNEFGFGKLYGMRTIEVRAIFEDNRYVTYTCLANIQKTDEQKYGSPGQPSSEIFA